MNKKFSVLTKNKIHKYNKKIDGREFPDKSISHRVYLLASQCLGISRINGSKSEDVQKATINALKKLGIKIVRKGDWDYVYGMGISGFKKFQGIINFSNSGTSLRSFLGILACYPWPVTLTGDSSLRRRPISRLTDYLERIGATITHPKNKKFTLPVRIHGTREWALAQKHYLKVPSAQMSNALILAGIQCNGITEIIESSLTRDHTQRLLKSLNADIQTLERKGKRITKIRGQVDMQNFSISVPGDFSNSMYLIVQTLLTEKSSLVIKSVCINKNRIGAYYILKAMGAKIKFFNKRKYFNEEVADIHVKSSKLKGIKVTNKKFIITAIDDLMAVWVACVWAKGKSHFSGNSLLELQLKESKRITTMSENLKRFGVKTHTTKSSITIYGSKTKIKIKKFIKIPRVLDHRVLLSMYVLATISGSKVLINGFETVSSSFPNWLKLQKQKFGSKYEIVQK